MKTSLLSFNPVFDNVQQAFPNSWLQLCDNIHEGQ